MRRMLFATFLLPGTRHHVELVHPYRRFDSCGVTRIDAWLFDREGRELASRRVPLDKTVVDLAAVFPADLPAAREGAMVLTDVAYNMPGKKHPYQYGFLYQNRPEATPLHYPLDIAMGLTNAINYFPNHGYFPLGLVPPWLRLRLYLGNVSEHCAIEPEVTLVRGAARRSFTVPMAPLAHRLVDLPAQDEALDYLTVAGEVKPVCYVAGVDARSGALTFLEHLMQTFRPDAEEGGQGYVAEPETLAATVNDEG